MDCYNGDEDYLSLQDMIDRDIASGACAGGGDMFAHAVDGSAGGVHGGSGGGCGGGGDSHLRQQHSSHCQLPSSQHPHGVPTGVDLDSSVSNLSWLHAVNIGSLRQEPDNRNPSLMVNPQTVAPAVGQPATTTLSSSPMRVIEVTLPSNVQITGSSVRYVTVPEAARTMYVAGRAAAADIVAGSPHKPALAQLQQTLSYQQHHHHPQQQQQGYYTNCSTHSSVINNPYPKPAYSYSCLIAMALKNSKTGSLPVSEIYNFMTSNFPYFKTAPDGWKNSVRHNLSLNKCFEKIENPNSDGASSRKGCLWSLNPAKARKMDEEIAKWNKKDPQAIKRSMAKPETFDILERGQASTGSRNGNIKCDVHDISPGRTPTPMHATDTMNEPMSFAKQEHMEDHQHCDIIPAEPMRTCHDSASHMVHDDLALDPVLSDMSFQNSIWDELTGEVIDFPFNGSPAEFSHTNHTGSPYSSAISPESMSRFHGAYACKSSGAVSSSVPEGLGPRNIGSVARFVPATT